MYILLFSLLLFHTCLTDGKDVVVVYFAASDATSGLVKVRVNGSSTSSSRGICWDSQWGLEEAHVTCRQMGFLKATATGNVSGSAIRPILFEVRCLGNETNLADCSYNLSGPCRRNLSVNVTCSRNPAFKDLFDVHLNGPAAHKGIVETRQTFQGNTKQPWFVQCYELWSKEDSEVVCRQLGYSGVKATTRVVGSLPNVVDGEPRCTGKEQTLRGCYVFPTAICTDKTTYPQVECSLDSETQQPFDVRLAGGNTSAGSVEILKYGKWGIICDTRDGEWNLASARVVCQQLGFVDATRVTEPAEFGQGNGSIYLKNPNCSGDEWSLETCPLPSGWGGGVKQCQTKDTAGVVCSPEKFPAYDISSTLYTPNASESFGRFFLHSPGFPQLFNYEANAHLICTMTTENFTEISLYIHYKRFQENHIETLSFQANDTQSISSTFYRLQLYGNDSDPGPYITNTTSLTMEFKSNSAKGSGKIRIEIRVPKSTDVSMNCSNQTLPTTSSTSTTSVTSQGINTTVTTTVMVTNTTTTNMTAVSTTGGFTEPIAPPVSLTTDQTNSTPTDPDPTIPIVASLVPLVVVAVIIVVVVVVIKRRRGAKPTTRSDAAPEPDPDDSGIFEMDQKLKKSKKSANVGKVNVGFEDVDIKSIALYQEADLESAEMKPVLTLNPPVNYYNMDIEPSGKGNSANEDPAVAAVDPSQTYAMVNKIRKKPRVVEASADVDADVYSVVNKPKSKKGNGDDKPVDGLGYANDGFEEDSPDFGKFQGQGDPYPAMQGRYDPYAEVSDRIEEQDVDSKQFEDSRPEFATYAEVGRYGAPRPDLDVRAKDPVKPASKPDKKKSKKGDKPDKKTKLKLNPFSKVNKKEKGDKPIDAKEHVYSPRPRDYDYIDAQFQVKNTPSSGGSRVCSPYAEVDLASLSSSGAAGSRARTPVPPEESTEGDVYNRLNFPMLKKGATSFAQKPQNLTYDCVNYGKYQNEQNVQSENPYEDYGARAADSKSVDLDNPYTEEAPVSNKGGATGNPYEEALPVSGRPSTSSSAMWDDGPEEFL